MRTETHAWKGRGLGLSGSMEKVFGSLSNAATDTFRRMEDGDTTVGLPFDMELHAVIRNADGTGAPTVMRVTVIVERIALEEAPEACRREFGL